MKKKSFKISYSDIAKAACSHIKTVEYAVKKGKLDTNDLFSIAKFIIKHRIFN
jgi:hypothetical protein